MFWCTFYRSKEIKSSSPSLLIIRITYFIDRSCINGLLHISSSCLLVVSHFYRRAIVCRIPSFTQEKRNNIRGTVSQSIFSLSSRQPSSHFVQVGLLLFFIIKLFTQIRENIFSFISANLSIIRLSQRIIFLEHIGRTVKLLTPLKIVFDVVTST